MDGTGLRHYRARVLQLAAVLAAACESESRPAARDTVAAIPVAPAESLALSSPAGVEVWFTLARDAHSADGEQCLERGLEIRRGTTRLKIPLLYTGEPPALLNDTTMRAVLWTHCKPVAKYLVDLRTGRPVPEATRGKSQ
jgi:hypothetical protein